MKQKMIFHIPFKIDFKRPSGSMIRPVKMIEAFKQLGYEVDLIEGYIHERKNKIQELLYKIRNGAHYDFIYSESSTMPTALTEKNHFPKKPFLDFDFFKFCKLKDIPIGLFYRDVYWMYPDLYDINLPFMKRVITKFFYRYDLRKYEELVDVIFLPSLRMSECLENYKFTYKALPPGLNTISNLVQEKNNDAILKLFYIGGISKLYDFSHITSAVKNNSNLELTICCRKEDLVKNEFLNDISIISNIKIVHKNGDGLRELYNNADICISSFKHHPYWDFAMGVKNFEYLSFGKPIVGTKNTAIGDFIEKSQIGWTIDDSEDEAAKLLGALQADREKIQLKRTNIESAQLENLWTNRAKLVINTLLKQY